jgi:hypothetical protein
VDVIHPSGFRDKVGSAFATGGFDVNEIEDEDGEGAESEEEDEWPGMR